MAVVVVVVDCEVALITVFNSLASLWGVPTSRRRRSPTRERRRRKHKSQKGGGKKIFQEKPREPFTEQFCKEK